MKAPSTRRTRGAIPTWRNTPVLHHSAWPNSRTRPTTRTRTRGRSDARRLFSRRRPGLHRKGTPCHGNIHDFPYLEQVSKHFETVTDHPHFGLGRIRPMHRHLHHNEIHRLRQEQCLDIKGEAVNLLSFKNFTRSLRPEPFEPALGIQKLETGQSADHPIESVAH